MATATKTTKVQTACPVWHKDASGKAADFEDHSGAIEFDDLRDMTELDEYPVNPRFAEFVLDEIEKNPLATLVSVLVAAGAAVESDEMVLGISPEQSTLRAARAIILAADAR
jgi:hypothetical protein